MAANFYAFKVNIKSPTHDYWKYIFYWPNQVSQEVSCINTFLTLIWLDAWELNDSLQNCVLKPQNGLNLWLNLILKGRQLI